MNLYKQIVVLMACVAAIALSGCSTSVDATPPAPVVTANPAPGVPENYDELTLWTDMMTIPEMKPASDALGVELYVPYQTYIDKGYIGIGALEANCVVTVLDLDAEQGLMAIVVMSRYDLEYQETIELDSFESAKAFIDERRVRCGADSSTSA